MQELASMMLPDHHRPAAPLPCFSNSQTHVPPIDRRAVDGIHDLVQRQVFL